MNRPPKSKLYVIRAVAIAAFVVAGYYYVANLTSHPMLTSPCRKGDDCRFSWTLTSRLGHMLETYEKILGPRDGTYRMLGIEFTTSNHPQIWYPDFGNGLASVIVQLTGSARHDRNLALFQLGHEAFHLIEPVKPGTSASYFEEGLANYFSVLYLKQNGIRGGAAYLTEKKYRLAYDLVIGLTKHHRDFNARLKRFREQNRSFSNISTGDILAVFPETETAVARQLARPFGKAAPVR